MAELKIDVQDLHKSYGDNEVLKGIDAKFYEGDVVCIIGPSGSGKSTFLRTLNLLETITSGKVVVDGFELSDKNTNVDKARENIGMVFQHFNLFPHMSVLDNITFAPIELGKESRKAAEQHARELLEKVGLSDKADAMPESLSGRGVRWGSRGCSPPLAALLLHSFISPCPASGAYGYGYSTQPHPSVSSASS